MPIAQTPFGPTPFRPLTAAERIDHDRCCCEESAFDSYARVIAATLSDEQMARRILAEPDYVPNVGGAIDDYGT